MTISEYPEMLAFRTSKHRALDREVTRRRVMLFMIPSLAA